MKKYNDWVSRLDYAKSMYEIHGFEKCLNDNEIFFRAFTDMGFQNLYSYYSVVLHERYFKEHNELKCFAWRDGGPYFFEFNTEIDDLLKLYDKEAPIKQISAHIIEVKLFTTTFIKQIHDRYFYTKPV